MENQNSLVNLHTDKEKIIIGKDYIKLEDLTKATFQTETITDFIEYMTQFGTEAVVFANIKIAMEINAYLKKDLRNVTQTTKPVARCVLVNHPALDALRVVNGNSYGHESFLEKLESLKKYLTGASLGFLDNLQDLSIKKVLKVKKNNDQRGNFNYTISAEGGGKDDYLFPKSVSFSIPLFGGMSLVADVPFDLNFRWSLSEEGNVKLIFKIVNHEMDQLIREIKNELIIEELGHGEYDIFKGVLNIIPQDNRHIYQDNGVSRY